MMGRGKSPVRRATRAVCAALLAVLAVACGNAAPAPVTPTRESPVASPDGITPILATRVLEVGQQRVSFLLTSPRALIKAPEARVTATYQGEDAPPAEIRTARFHLWPYAIRGAYSTELTFDRAGPWQLDISVSEGEVTGTARLALAVVTDSPVPGIGSVPPESRTKTVDSVDSLAKLTTDSSPDADLYRLTVAEAIRSQRPSVIVFATPAFCTSPTCGPQVDTVSELKVTHGDRANFVHVELYDNPDQIQGDLTRAELADAVEEWGFTRLPDWFNESWTFVLDANGVVAQRFEGFATLEELDAALGKVLPPVASKQGPAYYSNTNPIPK